jgi:capsular polysaccharide export protein
MQPEPGPAVALSGRLADTRPRLALLTRGLQRVATLDALLPEWQLVRSARPRDADAVLAWGQRPSAETARVWAERHGLTLLRAEDGFLRSLGLGSSCPPLSIVLDDRGMHFDVSAPSRIEALIATPCSAVQQARGERLQRAWVEARVSKYNHVRDGLPEALLPSAALGPVLVIDQTAGDASIRGAGADPGSFRRMLEAALDEHPRAPIWLKVHPDVIAGHKRGHFADLPAGAASRILLIADDVHPPALIEASQAVYVVSSQMGFEALLRQRPVRCFGLPFYAGWGLTRDALPRPERRAGVTPTLGGLVHAALVAYPRCLDPETGQRTEPETLIAHLGLQRRMRDRLPTQVQVLGFSRWKRPIARVFLQGTAPDFVRRPAGIDPQRPVAVWGRREIPVTADQGPPVRTLRVEDGFIRSVGLGADLVRPLSWVVDDLGIYFDATVPSRLEHLLRHYPFDAALRARAAALRQTIVAAGLTKYNVGQGDWQRPPHARRVVLVPGQVETDASIRWGAADIRTNAELLAAVRQAEPQAWLVYKPHPDVVAGLRHGGAAPHDTLPAGLCDEVVVDTPMHRLLDQVDAVHTLTSLTGFEALMRGRAVSTWGLPFYAGWGLTDDRAPADHPALQRRRQREQPLQLDELVAATLILYPSYVSRRSGAYTTPERALQELREWRDRQARDGESALDGLSRHWRRLRRQALGWLARQRGA